MSKIDIGVGDEFPLDESRDDGHAGRRGRHRRGHRGHHHHHGHHHHRHHGFGRLPVLLIVAGVIGLAVTHQLTAAFAYGLIGAGVGIIAVMFLIHAIWHWRHRRGLHNTPSQAA